MERESLLKWLKEFEPEHLEQLLREGRLDQYLAQRLEESKQYRADLEKRRYSQQQVDELVLAALCPPDSRLPRNPLSREGKRLLAQWEEKDRA